MSLFVLRRLLATIPVLVIVGIIVFLMLRFTPGDAAAIMVGDTATADDVARVRTNLGLDHSLGHQFVVWAGQLLQGDLGTSYYFRSSVTSLIAQRLEPTLSLAAVTLVFAVFISVPLGVLAAWRHGGWLDRGLMGFSVLGFSIPVFVLGYVFIWLFALKLGWFPTQGYARISEGFGIWLQHLAMPAFALSIVFIALIARVTRASVAEALTEDYVRTARAKGISEARVVLCHALTNAAIPIITVIGIGIATMIGGVVVTETVFAIPGLGQLTVDAVLSKDYPVIQGITLFFSCVYVLVNLLIDLSYVLFDPRVRY